MKKLPLVLLIVTTVVGCIGVFYIARAPNAVALSIVGHTNNPDGTPTTIFQVTNGSSRSLVISYGTQVATLGPIKWNVPKSQLSTFRFGQPLAKRSSITFQFSTPSEGPPWRAYVIYASPPGTLMARIDDFFKKFKLTKKTIIISPEISK